MAVSEIAEVVADGEEIEGRLRMVLRLLSIERESLVERLWWNGVCERGWTVYLVLVQ